MQPALSLETSTAGDAAVVHLRGKLTAGVTDVLREEVKRLIPGHKHIVLDLTNLAQMDSMGLGTLVSLYVSARTSGCRRERELLKVSNLFSVFENLGEHDMRIF